jgi:hypothetical protein
MQEQSELKMNTRAKSQMNMVARTKYFLLKRAQAWFLKIEPQMGLP